MKQLDTTEHRTKLLQAGHVYVGVPPLYKLEAGKKSQYCYDEAELAAKTKGMAPGSYTIQRFKVHTYQIDLP